MQNVMVQQIVLNLAPQMLLNSKTIKHMHPALRSRIRGYGYEVYMEETFPDNEENRNKLAIFVAQEVIKDAKIPHFSREAVMEKYTGLIREILR